MEIDRHKIAEHVNLPVMKLVGEVADEMGIYCYVEVCIPICFLQVWL